MPVAPFSCDQKCHQTLPNLSRGVGTKSPSGEKHCSRCTLVIYGYLIYSKYVEFLDHKLSNNLLFTSFALGESRVSLTFLGSLENQSLGDRYFVKIGEFFRISSLAYCEEVVGVSHCVRLESTQTVI